MTPEGEYIHLIDVSELELSTQIGEGSLGQVWKGTMGGVDVAVKKIVGTLASPHIMQEVEKELELLASLRHPNVIQLYGVCICAANEFWLVMEYADRGSLYSYFAPQEHMLQWNTRCNWIRDVVNAVAFLHQRGVVHRNLKSSNSLVVKGTIKVCDFGMPTTKSVASSSIKSAGSISTARWLAPESSAMEPVYNTATDVYGMGMVLWEIMAEDTPFHDVPLNDQVIHLVKHEQQRPILPRFWPALIQSVIQKCWSQNPSERPTAQQVSAFIQQSFSQIRDKPPSFYTPVWALEFTHEDLYK